MGVALLRETYHLAQIAKDAENDTLMVFDVVHGCMRALGSPAGAGTPWSGNREASWPHVSSVADPVSVTVLSGTAF